MTDYPSEAPEQAQPSVLQLQLQHGVNLAYLASRLETENSALREALAAALRERDATRA